MENELIVNHFNQRNIVRTPSANNFELYLKRVLSDINSQKFNAAREALLWDAKVKDLIFNNINI
jgi:hypothetical protein